MSDRKCSLVLCVKFGVIKTPWENGCLLRKKVAPCKVFLTFKSEAALGSHIVDSSDAEWTVRLYHLLIAFQLFRMAFFEKTLLYP